MRRLPRFLQILGVNSVPVVGLFAADWSEATALALYWCENVMVIVLVGLLIRFHRCAARKREDRKAAPERSVLPAGYFTTSLFITAGHAVILGSVLFMILPDSFPEAAGIDLSALRNGVLVVAVLLISGFSLDAIRLGDQPFARLQRMAERVQGRVVLLHFTILFGMVAMVWLDAPRGLFLVFAGLKTLSDLGVFLGRDELPRPQPSQWMVSLIRRVAGARKAEDFVDFYREKREQGKAGTGTSFPRK